MNQTYFTINLNKHGELKQQEEAEKKIFLNFVVCVAAATVILISILIYFNSNLGQKLANRQNFYRERQKELEGYRTSGNALSSGDLERLANTSTNRVFWSRKLRALSDSISDKIAVTHFSYKNGIFSLYGITKVDDEEKEFDIINDFIATLKQNEDIVVDFPEIKFVRSTRDREKEVDIIRFQIDCIGSGSNTRGGRR